MRRYGTNLIFVACWILVCIGEVPAQTLNVRQSISDGRGLDDLPKIASLGSGCYAVIWVRQTSSNKWSVFGRVVDMSGTMLTPIRKNPLGTSVYVSSGGGHDAGAHGDGACVIAGSLWSNTRILTRRFDASLRALGALSVAAQFGFYPSLARGPIGTALSWYAGGTSGHTYVALLDAAGRASGTPLEIQATSTSRIFVGQRILPAPTGFLVVGEELPDDYSQRRAVSSLIAADVSSATKAIPYEAFYPNNNNYFVDAGFDGQSGLLLFGNDVGASLGYYRPLKADGKPKGPAKRMPSASDYAAWLRVEPISGAGQFACTWYVYPNGYLQIRRRNGAPVVATPVALSTGRGLRDNTVDMAYDSASGKLLVAWAENVDSTSTSIWIAIFDL